MPSYFKGQKDKKAKSDKDADVEAGEKEELLEAVEVILQKRVCCILSYLTTSVITQRTNLLASEASHDHEGGHETPRSYRFSPKGA